MECEQWTGNNLNDDNSLFQDIKVQINKDGSAFSVPSFDGPAYGHKGDWLIKDASGTFFTLPPASFEKWYELID